MSKLKMLLRYTVTYLNCSLNLLKLSSDNSIVLPAIIIVWVVLYLISLSKHICLALSLLMGVIYLFNPNPTLLITIGWVLFLGYITFVITGHLYKIVPFLVWYERFSPLIGKQKVPMLADMVPEKSAKYQFWFSTRGVVVCAIGLLLSSNMIFSAGVSFLFVGSIFMIKDLMFMINYK